MDEVAVSGNGFTFGARWSRWRRRWVGRCTCGATLKPIFTERSCEMPLAFMKIHGEASHGWEVSR